MGVRQHPASCFMNTERFPREIWPHPLKFSKSSVSVCV